MCLSVFLLADRPLPVPADQTMYPGLKMSRLESEGQGPTLAGIQRVAPQAIAYSVWPANYCGCYFGYRTPDQFAADMAERAANPELEYANTPEEAETMWRSLTSAVQSFGKYLTAHSEAQLAVYAVWENCAGEKAPIRAEAPPSYFGGPGFEKLPEDVLITIVPEPANGETIPWDPAAPRTHEWLACEATCELPNDEDASE